MTKPLPRWIAHLQAVVLGSFWRPCPSCNVPFGGHERAATDRFATIPGGEHVDRIICPVCTDHGVGCLAHAGAWHHNGCEYVTDTELWPADDTDVPPGRSGPYPLSADGVKTPPAGFAAAAMMPMQEAANRMFAKLAAVGFSVTDVPPGLPKMRLVGEPVNAKELYLPGVAEIPSSSLSADAAERVKTRAAERQEREAAARAEVLARHAELVADAQTAEVKQLLEEHVPVEDGGRLECRGCARIEDWNGDGDFIPYWPEAPCPTWKTMDSLNRRAS
ncbi:hypothetical protein [Amycolatopsis sp. NPDC059657]|uniref:hypothetical protein n=1 Tax=Amycolatopsis sp. NPDC059657 TaxID=3346899 RepID=UPI003672E054